MPAGYFHAKATQLLNDFREAAVEDRREEMIDKFPEAGIVTGLQNSWYKSASSIYSNWLQYIASRKTQTPAFAAMAPGAVRSSVADNEIA